VVEVVREVIKNDRSLDVYNINQTLDELRARLDELKETNNRFGTQLTDIPRPVALFETSLASAISSSASTMTLVSATDKDGNTLASSTYAFIIDEGTASEEFVIAGCTGTACTGMIRGVSVLTGTTTVAALAKAHRRGASVKITDAPLLLNLFRMINGIGRFPNTLTYLSSAAACSDNDDICDKSYIDTVAVAGAPDANATTKGIVEIASGLETASSTAAGAGSTTADLVPPTSVHSANPKTSGYWVPVTRNDGKLDPNFIATNTDPVNWGTEQSFLKPVGVGVASTSAGVELYVQGRATIGATTTTQALKSTSTAMSIGGPNYEFPSAVCASGETWVQKGSGKIKCESNLGAAVSLIPFPMTNATNTTTVGLNTNTQMNTGAFVLNKSITVNKLSVQVENVGTSGTFKACVYSESGAAKEIDVTSGTVSAAGVETISVSAVTLDAGVHYFGFVPVSTTNITVMGWENNSAVPLMHNVASEPDYAGDVTVTAGTCATTITTSSLGSSSRLVPVSRLDN